MKIQDNKGQYRLTIPRDIAKLKGWKQGTEVVLILDKDGHVTIKEIPQKSGEQRDADA